MPRITQGERLNRVEAQLTALLADYQKVLTENSMLKATVAALDTKVAALEAAQAAPAEPQLLESANQTKKLETVVTKVNAIVATDHPALHEQGQRHLTAMKNIRDHWVLIKKRISPKQVKYVNDVFTMTGARI